MGLQHGQIAIADRIFDQPVLPRLKARRLAQTVAKGGVVRGRHRAQHVPGVVQLFKDPADPGQHLERLGRAVRGNRVARGVQLMQRKAHPELRGLVLNDEQHLIMRARQQALGVENTVDLQIVAIGHAAVERHLSTLAGGVIGGHETLRRCEGKGASGDAAPPVQHRKIADLPPQARPA